jgi:hypothetical protein
MKLCDEDCLQAELVFLRDILKQNSSNGQHINRALNRRPHSVPPNSRPNRVAFLPVVKTIFNSIARVLARHNIKSVGLPP